MSLFSRVNDFFIRLWTAWSAVQDREDDIWRETIGENSDAPTEDESGKKCGPPKNEIPELSDLVAQRNRERKNDSS